jgi:hypothetical protein
LGEHRCEGRGGIVAGIADKDEAAAGQEQPVDLGNGCRLDETPPPVAFLRPWIRKQEIDRGERPVADRRQEMANVVVEDPDVGKMVGLDRRQQLGDAIDEGLGADEADAGSGGRLGSEMLAAAEADLELDRLGRWIEQESRRGKPRVVAGDLELGQQIDHETRLVRAQRVADAAAVELIGTRRAGQTRKSRNWSTRSVFSHEKPPSLSGGRPK